MKRFTCLFVFLMLARPLWAYYGGWQVIIVNVGTNSLNISVSAPNLDNGSGGATLLPGQSTTNISGLALGNNGPLWVNWSPYVGAGKQYNRDLGTFNNTDPGTSGNVNLGTIPVCGTGTPTNCTDTILIQNNDVQQHTYQLVGPNGNAGTITVLGGSTQVVMVQNPGCIPGQWSYYAIPGYISLGPPGYEPNDNPGIGPGDNPVLPANSGTSVSPAPNNNLPPPNVPPSPLPIAPNTNNAGTNALLGANTNGPINYGTGAASSPTNAANNGTIQATGNALYTATIQSEQGIIDAIQTMDKANRAGHAGTSNMIGQLTASVNGDFSNLVGSLSNSPMANDTAAYTNGVIGKADAASAAGQAALQSAGDSLGTIAAPTIPPVGTWQITVNSQTFDIDPLSTSSMFPQVAGVTPWVRRLSEWAMTLWFVIWLVGEINSAIRTAFCAPQSISGDALPVVAEIEGAVIGGVVVFVLYVALTAAIAYLTSSLVSTYLAHPFDGSGPQSVQSGIAWLDAVFDIGLCLSLSAQRVSIPFYLTKLVYRAVSVIRFLS